MQYICSISSLMIGWMCWSLIWHLKPHLYQLFGAWLGNYVLSTCQRNQLINKTTPQISDILSDLHLNLFICFYFWFSHWRTWPRIDWLVINRTGHTGLTGRRALVSNVRNVLTIMITGVLSGLCVYTFMLPACILRLKLSTMFDLVVV